jgi:outer membrane receptor protein involved in Fe transport
MFRNFQSCDVKPSRRRLIAAFAVFTILLFAFNAALQAQVLYGSLTGNVTDPSGAFVSGAKVEALNTLTGVTQTATTDADGVYRFQNLQPGTYKVTISASGFATAVQDNIAVTVNTIKRADTQLAVAGTQTVVAVTAEQQLLQTDKADVHTDLTTSQITNMPISGSQGRNFQTLLRIIPGAALPAETNSLAGNPQRSIFANVNGQSQTANNTRIDGAQDIYPWLPSNVAYVPPADAIETVNVVTNSFDAEQGQAGGAAMNVQVKSGTNSFHGMAHWFHFDQNFAARDYFQTNTTRFPKKNRNNQNQFGGQYGGPIKKDKLFFFVDYERTTQRQLAGPDTRTLPTAAMATGDFRNLPGNPIIYDPATGNLGGTGKQQISCNGVLNVICPNRIDPASAAMIKLLQPQIAKEFTTATLTNNFIGSGTALFNRDSADGKINYVISDKSTVFGRYSFSKTLVFDPPLLGDAVGDATNGGQLGNAPGLVQSVGLGATHIFTPNMLLDWNFGFTRLRLSSTFDLTSAKGLNDLKIPGTNNVGTTGDPSIYYGLPGFIFPVGLNIGNAQNANPFLFRDGSYVTGANLSWNHGKHGFRGGIEWNHSQMNHFQPQVGTFNTPRGAFNFNGMSTSLTGTTATWFNQWADFMLGLSDHSGKAIQSTNPNALRWSQWAWYLRDQWQVTPRLTATLGVRWEYYPFGYSDNGKGLRYLNLATGNVLIGGNGNIPQDDGVDVGGGQFLPRVGLAYRLTSSTVIRAGYGMNADSNNWRDFRNSYPANVFIDNTTGNSNAIAVTSLTGLNATIASGAKTLPSGVVLSPIPDVSSGTIPLPTNITTTTIPQPFRRGYIHNFNLMVEQEWKGFVLNTGYVGARGIRPLVQLNMNASAAGTGAAGGLLSQALGKTYTGSITGLVPFKNNYYDSMQTKLTRRFHDGSLAGVSWTWSKTIDYADNDDLGSVGFPYPAYWQKSRAVAGYDRTHNVSIYGVLQLPFGKGERWAQTGIGNAILGGWQISPLINYLTGLPFTVNCPGALNANGTTQTCDLIAPFHVLNGKPNRDGICALTDLSCRYFDPSSFAAPLITSNANAHLGNTNRNEFRGPGYFGMNLSLARQFKLTERFGLQIRADAINFTNTPHFANPTANNCPADATHTTNSGVCSAGSPTSTFGAITGGLQPGGFFGPDHGARQVWLAARVTF